MHLRYQNEGEGIDLEPIAIAQAICTEMSCHQLDLSSASHYLFIAKSTFKKGKLKCEK